MQDNNNIPIDAQLYSNAIDASCKDPHSLTALERLASFEQSIVFANLANIKILNKTLNEIMKYKEKSEQADDKTFDGFTIEKHYKDYRPSIWFVLNDYVVQFYISLGIPSVVFGKMHNEYNSEDVLKNRDDRLEKDGTLVIQVQGFEKTPMEESDFENVETSRIIEPIFMPFSMSVKQKEITTQNPVKIEEKIRWFLRNGKIYIQDTQENQGDTPLYITEPEKIGVSYNNVEQGEDGSWR